MVESFFVWLLGAGVAKGVGAMFVLFGIVMAILVLVVGLVRAFGEIE